MVDQEETKRYLEKEKRKFESLQELLKQVSKTNETSLMKRVKFRKKWGEIALAEQDPKLSQAFGNYTSAIEKADGAHHSCLQRLKEVTQKALRLYPEKIKSHRRSLSEHKKAKQTMSEYSMQLKKLQEQKDMRSVSQPMMHKASTQLEQSEKEVRNLEDRIAHDLSRYREEQVDDLKKLLLHLLNTEMHYHATALEALCDVVPQLNGIDPAASIRSRTFR